MKELKTLQKAAYIYTFVGVTWFSAPYLVRNSTQEIFYNSARTNRLYLHWWHDTDE